MEYPVCGPPLKAALLKRLTQRYPDLDVESITAMTHLQWVAKALTDEMNQPLVEHGLSEGKFFILIYLFSEDLLGHEEPSPSDIAENLGVTRATITGLLDGLERDGMIQRRHSNVDRRALTVSITEKATAVLDEFVPTQAARISRLLSPLSASETTMLIRLLAKIDPLPRGIETVESEQA